MHGHSEDDFTPDQLKAYRAWQLACREMTATKAAYDLAMVKVRDATQAMADVADQNKVP